MSDSDAGTLFLLFMAFIYFLPTIIALSRGNPQSGAVFAVNLIFGWTFIGWFVAFFTATLNFRREKNG